MEKNTLEFIKKNNEELYFMLLDPVETPEESDKSDEQLFLEAAADCPNPKIKLYSLLLQAKSKQCDVLAIARQAALLHDYVTALHWHEKISLSPSDPQSQFERRYYSFCAERQRKEDPKACPVTSAEQMLESRTEAGKELRDTSYPEVQYNFRKAEKQAYKNGFEQADVKTFQPLLRKIDKLSNIGCLLSAIVAIFALVFLFYSVPKVWAWSDTFFTNMSYRFFLMELFTWIVPLVYIIALVVLAFVLISLSMDPTTKSEEQLAKLITERERKIRRDVRILTDEGIKYYAMNSGISKEHRNYPHRLVLAMLADIYGEENKEKLSKLWDQTQPDTWLLRMAGEKEKTLHPYYQTSHPYYKTVCRMLENPSHESDIFIACTLYMAGHGWGSGSIYDDADLDGKISDGKYSLDILRSVAYHIYNSNAAKVLTQYIYNYLQEYYKRAKSQDDNSLLGEVCYQLYTCCDDPDIRYTYGREGIEHSLKLKFAVMKSAIENQDRSYALGYDRSDAIEYIQELRSKGHPAAEKLQLFLDIEIKREQKRRQEELELREAEREWKEKLSGVSERTSDTDSPFTILALPEVITGPYQRTYRKQTVHTYGADYMNEFGQTTTIRLSDIKAGITGYSANNGDGYFYW